MTFLKLMAYRMRYLTGIATYTIFVGGQFAVWRAVYGAQAGGPSPSLTKGGLTLAEMATYLAIGYLSRSAYFSNTDSEIAGRFQTGDVVIDLIRPVNFHGQWMAQAMGETAFRLLFFALPMSLVIVPLFAVRAPHGNAIWEFPLLFLMAFVINAELNILAGTASFFLEDITGLMSLKRSMIMLLSGLMVPLNLLAGFPFIGHGLVAAITILPFGLISYYPVMAYVGKLRQTGVHTMAGVVVLGLSWWIILRVANLLLWQRARGRLEIQGG